MMSTDSRIVSDLAVVGRASRAHPRTVEHTLRQVAAPRANASRTLSALYAARAARVWSSIVLLIGIVVQHPVFGTTTIKPRGGKTFHIIGAKMSAYELGALLGGMALAVYVAVRFFLRRRPVSRAAFDRLDRWSVALGVAAPLALVLFIGYLRIVTGDYALNSLFTKFDEMDTWDGRTGVYAVMGGVIVASFVVAFVASRLVRHERWATPRWWVGIVGVVGFVTTIIVALHHESGPITYGLMYPLERHSTSRIVLLVAAGVSLVAVLATFNLLRRRRELRALDGEQATLDERVLQRDERLAR